MSAAFTPGPWHVFASGYAERYQSVEINTKDGLTVAYARNFVREYTPQSEANARLIAAAPELYEALGACLAVAERPLKNAMNLKGKSPFDIGMDALRKARGES